MYSGIFAPFMVIPLYFFTFVRYIDSVIYFFLPRKYCFVADFAFPKDFHFILSLIKYTARPVHYTCLMRTRTLLVGRYILVIKKANAILIISLLYTSFARCQYSNRSYMLHLIPPGIPIVMFRSREQFYSLSGWVKVIYDSSKFIRLFRMLCALYTHNAVN